jgi:hypothetical protein
MLSEPPVVCASWVRAGRRNGASAVSGTRWLLAGLAAVVLTAPAEAGLFPRKPKSDARVRQLIETLRGDPDEKKRRAAVAELREADPRTQPDVIAALVAVLQRDPSAPVRAEAAEALGQFKGVFPLAGVALETAAESDPARVVREAAQQSLWEYHINGYRSAKGADGIAGQTPEPPIARPAPPRPTIVPVTAATPIIPPPPAPPVGPPLPTVAPPPVAAIPSVLPVEVKSGLRVVVTSAPPPSLNVTAEPPLAKPGAGPVSPMPTPAPEPRPAGAAATIPPPSSVIPPPGTPPILRPRLPGR